MKKYWILIAVVALLLPSVRANADPIGTYASYGVWFDRDGVDASQAASWGAVNGGTYNTGGIYDVVVTYHALTSTSGTMFATVNGIQQGFWDNGYATPAPDIYPAGLSFTADMTNLRVFDWLVGWGSESGTAVFEQITATGTRHSGIPRQTIYGDVTMTSAESPFVNVFTGQWDLTLGDLTLSYTADLSGVIGSSGDPFVAQIGLRTPVGYAGLVGRGMMGNVVDNSIANNGSLNYNDKFDLQSLGSCSPSDEHCYDTVVPEPSSMLLLASGLIGLAGAAKRRLRKR